MAGSTALGINRFDGQGTMPIDMRTIIDAMYQTTGVLKGLDVTGTGGLAYAVGAGVAVCQRFSGDGKTLAPYHGGQTPQVDTGDPSASRVDAIWIIAHNQQEQGDSDNLVTVGVTQGTPSVNPQPPQIPAGALTLATYLMPAGATSTKSATMRSNHLEAIPTSGGLGLIGQAWDNTDHNGPGKPHVSHTGLDINIHVPMNRTVLLFYKCAISSAGGDKITTEYHTAFQLDGKDIPFSTDNHDAGGTWRTSYSMMPAVIPEGRHHLNIRSWLGNGSYPVFHASHGGEDAGWVGELFQIYDMGQARSVTIKG